MDPLFVARPSAPPPSSSTLWQTIPATINANNNGIATQQLQHPQENIDFHFHNGGPRTFSSPPSTPMTPVPHHLQHMGFPPMQTHMEAGVPNGTANHHPLILYNIPADVAPPPALSHTVWPPCEYHLYKLCQELQDYPTNELINEETSKIWWDRFMMEYFHELATLVIEIDFGEGMQRYTVNRNYISWFFKSILHENGISRMNIVLGEKVVQHQHQLQRIVCSNAIQELEYITPHQTKVCCQGQLLVDFTLEDKPRVVQWVFHVVSHVELIPRFCLHAASLDSSLSTNITRKGLPAATQALLQQLNQSPSVSTVTTPLGKAPPNATGTSNNNNNIGPSIADTNCPPQLINYTDLQQQGGVAPSSWRDTAIPPVSGLQQTSDTGSTVVLSHLPLPLTQSPPPSLISTPQLSSSAPPTSTTSPVTSPVVNYVSLHSNGSTCSINSTSSSIQLHQPQSHVGQQTQSHVGQQTQSHVGQQTQSHVGQQTQSQSMKGGLNKKITSTNVTTATAGNNGQSVKAHKFMIASEPAYFSEEMVHGEDERLITRIENTRITTSATPSDSDTVTTPTQQLTNNNNITLSWLDNVANSVQCSWNIQMPPDQR